MQTSGYRNNGAIGALLDEYERALTDFKKLLATVQPAELTAIADPDTSDPDCRSIQTVLTHVVRSAFGYATYIRVHYGEEIKFPQRKTLSTVADYIARLDAAFRYTEETFQMHPEIKLEEYEAAHKIRVRWGQLYDVEQLMEHAIVHILRHRRQIERFLLGMRG